MMALEKTVSLQNNFKESSVFQNAYIKVEQIAGNKDSMVLCVVTRKSANGTFLTSYSTEFPYNINGDNPIAQAYAYLKTLPEFADAIDC